MKLEKIFLQHFRNFEEKLLNFSPSLTIIVGANATGKTNILESIYLLSTGKSFKAKIEEEMVEENEDFCRVKGLFGGESEVVSSEDKENTENKNKLEVVLARTQKSGQITENKTGVARKRMLVNGVGKRLIDFAGTFKVVLFGPWDMDLVTESPSIRRKFLDNVLSLSDREYRRSLLSYEKGLRQRNRLLYRIREENLSRGQLIYWDHLLIKNGDYISNKREEFIEYVNSHSSLDGHEFYLTYDKSAISVGRLEQYKNEEVAAATTLVGPHRDDFVFFVKSHEQGNRDLARYGSRGEQRMGVLWLKLSELTFLESVTGEKPALLLDDIFSELDNHHREIVMQAVKGQQTVITTADPHYLPKNIGIEKIQL
jgi:DNA replication and repair protein RecF